MSSSNSSGGIGICGLLFIVFLVLKLAGIGAVATWSWWWVTCPLWIGFAVAGIFLVGGILLTALAAGLAFLFCKK